MYEYNGLLWFFRWMWEEHANLFEDGGEIKTEVPPPAAPPTNVPPQPVPVPEVVNTPPAPIIAAPAANVVLGADGKPLYGQFTGTPTPPVAPPPAPAPQPTNVQPATNITINK